MNKGYVYILSNPAFPDLLKIGKTTRTPDQRAVELWSTGVPEPFKVEEFIHTPDCDALELRMHEHFQEYRHHASREFFKLPLKEVEIIFRDIAKDILGEFISEYDESYSLVEQPFVIDESDILLLADQCNLEFYEIPQCFHYIKPEHILDAYNRRTEVLARTKAGREAEKNELQVVQ